MYFNSDVEIIKVNCNFDFCFNKTNIKPSVLDGVHQIILANCPIYKEILYSFNNNIPIDIPIPNHPFVLLNRSILCNCGVEVESNFLLKSCSL